MGLSLWAPAFSRLDGETLGLGLDSVAEIGPDKAAGPICTSKGIF